VSLSNHADHFFNNLLGNHFLHLVIPEDLIGNPVLKSYPR
jgi:hypothetical protein